MREYINDLWYFKNDFRQEYLTAVNISEFEKIRIPHTVSELPLNYINNEAYQMLSTYYTSLDLGKYEGKSCFLVFEGNAHKSEVYVNGRQMAVHQCGYTAFKVDLNAFDRKKPLDIVLKLDSSEALNIPPFGNVIDYLTYGGVYRDTYLDIKSESYIEDVFVKADMHGNLKLQLQYHSLKNNRLRIRIADMDVTEEAKEEYCFEGLKVKTWDTEHPHLYTLQLELLDESGITDSFSCDVGFRTVTSDANGIYLNGKKIKLIGLNRHQSYAYTGYAMPERVERRDARILKYDLAVNTVRTSHYPDSHDFISECDRIGLLVFTEIPGWQHIGDESWQDVAVQNVRDMILQYRNHPSIFMWGVRINESADNHNFYVRTNEEARRLDDTRLIGGVRCIEHSELLEDVYTFNDFIHSGANEGIRSRCRVTDDKKRPLLVTEFNGHMYPTKMTDDVLHRTEHILRWATVLNDICASKEHAGGIGWCMADYNTHKDFGSGDNICYHGVLDIFRNKKPAAKLLASQGDGEIVLSVNSTFDIGDYPEGLIRNVVIMTNCDKVVLYQNDRPIKELHPSVRFKALKHPPIIIDELDDSWGNKSNGYRIDGIKDGQVVKSLTVEKFSSLQFNITTDTEELIEDKSYDVASVSIEAINQAGNHLNYFNDAVCVEVDGDIELIGPETVSLSGGFGGFYIKSKQEGEGLVKIFYKGKAVKELRYYIRKGRMK